MYVYCNTINTNTTYCTFLWLSDVLADTATSDWSGNFSELSTSHFSLSSCSDSTKCAHYSLSHQLLKPYSTDYWSLMLEYILEFFWISILYLSDFFKRFCYEYIYISLYYYYYCFSCCSCSTCLLTGFSNISLSLWHVGLADQRFANLNLYKSLYYSSTRIFWFALYP